LGQPVCSVKAEIDLGAIGIVFVALLASFLLVRKTDAVNHD